MKNLVRAFIAVEISRDVRTAIERLVRQMQSPSVNVKWVDTENLHLTMKFLGDVETIRIAEVCRAVERAVAGQKPFPLEIAGAGAFPRSSRPRTLWLGCTCGGDAMRQLHADVENELAELGFAREGRKFEPHLTIGRVRGGHDAAGDLARNIDEHADYAAGQITVTELVLFSSQLHREGPIYTALGRSRLGGS